MVVGVNGRFYVALESMLKHVGQCQWAADSPLIDDEDDSTSACLMTGG